MSLPNRDLRCIINDVFLPPKLPGASEGSSQDKFLVNQVLAALQEFGPLLGGNDRTVIFAAVQAIQNLKRSRDDYGVVIESELAKLLDTVPTSSMCTVLYLEFSVTNGEPSQLP